jgi:hypothetical protein
MPTVKGGLDPHMSNFMEDGPFNLVHYILWINCIYYLGLVYTFIC